MTSNKDGLVVGQDLEVLSGIGEPAYVTSEHGLVVDLTAASSQTFRHVHNERLDFQTEGITISLWARFESIPTDIVLIRKAQITDKYILLVEALNSNARMYIETSVINYSTLTENNSIPLNEWIHLMGVYDGSSLQIYINNQPSGTPAAPTGALVSDTASLYIGSGSDVDRYMDGQLSNILLWDRALNSKERQQIYEDGWQVYKSRPNFALADPLPDTRLLQVPRTGETVRTKQPLSPPTGLFDESNRFGQKCVATIIPAWGQFHESSSGQDIQGHISILGRKGEKRLPARETPASILTSAALNVTTMPYHNGRPVRVANFAPESANRGFYFSTDAATPLAESVELSDTFTVVGITYIPIEPVADVRIFCQDIGHDEQDHELMIGLINTGRTYEASRFRVRIDTTVSAVIPDVQENQLTDDTWVMVAGSLKGNLPTVHQLWSTAGGKTKYVSASQPGGTGSFSPVADTLTGVGNTVGGPDAEKDNCGEQRLLGVWFFDGLELTEQDLREFFDNPWQVFNTDSLHVPIEYEELTFDTTKRERLFMIPQRARKQP